MTKIYVLKCENNKYYIGKTNKSVSERFQEHINNPCAWTRKYPPISILNSFELKSEFDEDTTTLEYMKKYGIENVRGGTYTQLFLPRNQYITLKQQLTHNKDQCFKCYKQGHFSKDCPHKPEYFKFDSNDLSKYNHQQDIELENNCVKSCLELLRLCFKKRNVSNDYHELDNL